MTTSMRRISVLMLVGLLTSVFAAGSSVAAPPGRPDLLIRRGDSDTWVGLDVINDDSTDQQRHARLAPGGTRTFFIRVINIGGGNHRFRLHGCGGGADFSVRYFRHGHEVTRGFTSNTLRTPRLSPGEKVNYRMVIHVAANPTGPMYDCYVKGRSLSDDTKLDVVRARVIVQR